MSLTSGEGVPLTMPVEPAGYSNNGGWGGDGWWVIILFFIFAWGWGGNGFGNGFGGGNGNGAAAQGALTREQACIDNNFQNLMRETASISDSVNLGFANLNSTICNQQYDTARMIDNLGSTIQGGFNATNVALLQGQNAIQSQIAQCCCENREAIAGVNYNLATQACDTRNVIQTGTRDIIDNQNANTRAILDKLTAQELEAKNAQITSLNQQLFGAQLAASQTAQNQYLVNQLRPCPVPAYITCNPYSAAYGIGLANANGYNGGCGCNSYAA